MKIALSLIAAVAVQAHAQSADLVLTNGRLLTVDANDRVAQAVAVRDGRIVAVGTSAEIAKLAGPRTRRIDLAGRAVTPGLLDAHNHFSGGAAERLILLDLSYPDVKSIAEAKQRIAARVKTLKPGEWLMGRGWDEGKLAERRYITARDLDEVAPKNPVILTHTTGHYAVANSAALALAHITKATKDPPAGTIDRARDGTPTGVLKESAMELVRSLVPPPSLEILDRGIRQLAHDFNAEGMTGAKDPGIDTTLFNAYKRVLASGDLPVRIFVLWTGGTTQREADALIARVAKTTRPYESTGDDHLISGGVKLYMDGSGGARTAWLHQDWSKDYTSVDAGNRGYPAANPDTIRALIKRYHDAGMHVSVHSIGDRAIDYTVDSFDEALKAKPTKGLRHGIIHANIPSDHALDVMSRLQRESDAAYPEPSADFMWWLGDTYAGNFGKERALRLNPFATFLKRKIIWANGSDFPVTPFPARYEIWSAVSRETLLGRWGKTPFGTAESVDVKTALRAVTIWAARQMFLEKKIGSIEPGKYADLAVWDRDPYSIPTAALKDMRCEMTLFQGKVVFERKR